MDIVGEFVGRSPVKTAATSTRDTGTCRTCRWIWAAVIASLGLWGLFFALVSLLF